MVSALKAASSKQGVVCFTNDPDRSGDKRISTDQRVAELWNTYSHRYKKFSKDDSSSELVCVDEFWPKKSMHACLSSTAPTPKADVPECKCRTSSTSRDQAGQIPFCGCIPWLAYKSKPTLK